MSTIPITIQLPPVTVQVPVPATVQGKQGIQGPPGPPGAIPSGPPTIPLNAKNYGVLDNIANAQVPWNGKHDLATPGTATGTTSYVDAVNGRNFAFDYTANAGFRYSLGFAVDLTYPQNFCYDLQVQFVDPSEILILEMDMNQILADGRTCIFDCQIDSKSGTWMFDGWKPSRIVGNPQQWGTGWHRIRIFWHRSADGNTVTFDGVDFDGVWTGSGMVSTTRTPALGWKPFGMLMINWQIEGASKVSGEVSANSRNIHVWSW